MLHAGVKLIAIAAMSATLGAMSAMAGSSTTDHGVRVHRLIPKDSTPPRKPAVETHRHKTTPHRHRVILRPGQRVYVRLGNGYYRSGYRRKYSGVARPWAERKTGRRHRAFQNPPGLYSSKIYRRGYW